MQGVGARLCFRLHHRPARLRIFGIVVARRIFEFGNRVDGWIHDDNTQNRVIIVGAIDHEVLGAEALAVDVDLHALLGVLAGSMLPRHLLRTRHQQFEGGEIAVERGQVANLRGAQTGTDLGAVCNQGCRLARHADFLRDLAHNQLNVDTCRPVDAHGHVFLQGALEPRRNELHRVRSGQNMELGIVARFIRGRIVNRAAILAGDGNLDAWHYSARRVGDGSDNIPGSSLAIDGQRNTQAHNNGASDICQPAVIRQGTPPYGIHLTQV